MKIMVNLECDTFAEAERVFRHLGTMDAPQSTEQKPVQAATVAAQETTQAKPVHPTSAAPAAAPTVSDTKPSTAAFPSELSLDDVKASFREYVGRGGGRTAATAKAILEAHGLPAIRDARPEQFAVLKRAFDTAGPEHPLGEAA